MRNHNMIKIVNMLICVLLFSGISSCQDHKRDNDQFILTKKEKNKYINEYDADGKLLKVNEIRETIFQDQKQAETVYYETIYTYDGRDSLISEITYAGKRNDEITKTVTHTDTSKITTFYDNFPNDTFLCDIHIKRIEDGIPVEYYESKEYSIENKLISSRKTKRYSVYDENNQLLKERVINLSDEADILHKYEYEKKGDTLLAKCFDGNEQLYFLSKKYPYQEFTVEAIDYLNEDVDTVFYNKSGNEVKQVQRYDEKYKSVINMDYDDKDNMTDMEILYYELKVNP